MWIISIIQKGTKGGYMSIETSPNSVQGTAIVTGASSGLGKVYADRLAKRGYDLILIARRGDRLAELAQQLRKDQGVSVETFVADLGNPADLKRAADHVAADNRIAMLVNNAGTSKHAPSSQVPLADVDQQLAVNSKALTHLSLAVLPGFRERNRGTIINIGSVLSFYVTPNTTAYSGTKGQVMLFTLGLQQEVADTKITVQLVLPAATATEIWDVAGVGLKALDPATIMTAEDCVDAALAGLDRGEAVTLPSVDNPQLWAAFDDARVKLFAASQTGKPASRYGLGR
jgi:short-subunit dehydrogenase